MRWPETIGVMVLPRVILFPQSFLPLYIFEPRYRRMLADALDSHRLFCVALQQPGTRSTPSAVAGLGLIRVARDHPDGTSHVILHGIARVELEEVTRYRPYRTQRFRVLNSRVNDNVVVDALISRLLELVAHRLPKLSSGSSTPPLPNPLSAAPDQETTSSNPGGFEFLSHVNNPEQIADVVSWALLSNPRQRQLLLETLDVETRLRRLIQFLKTETDSEAGG